MTKISKFPENYTPDVDDLLIGTDVEHSNATKNFTIQSIINLVQQGLIPTLEQVTTAGNTTNKKIILSDEGLYVDLGSENNIGIDILNNDGGSSIIPFRYRSYNPDDDSYATLAQISSAGDLITNSFIKFGGNSSQYLMANGTAASNIATNTTTTALSLATLNSLYSTAIIGFRVHCISITAGKLIYEKTSTGWVSYSVNVVV